MVNANGGTSTPDAATSLREALHPGMGRTESGTLLQRATSTATSRARRHKRAKPLSLLPLVALCFYDVSGGPFGIEVGYHHIGVYAVRVRIIIQLTRVHPVLQSWSKVGL
jgi:hypothetical protein